jgi:hypothetical protein
MKAETLNRSVEKHLSNLSKPIIGTKPKYAGYQWLDVTGWETSKINFMIELKLSAGKIYTGMIGSRKYILY